MKKIIELFGLIVGLSAVLCLTIILIVNQGFYVGVTRFIPENNLWIKIPEIIIGLVTTIILIKIIQARIRK